MRYTSIQGIGIFHAANSRHYSLNLDFADLYKPIIVDRVIFTLVNRNHLIDSHFVCNDDKSVYLNENGKRIFIEAFNKKLNSKICIDGKSIRYYTLLEEDVRNYLKHIQNNVKYKPYKYY